jgi:hypothetical protein
MSVAQKAHRSATGAESLGDFIASPRIIVLALLAVPIGLIGAGLAWLLLNLIGLFTHLFFFGRIGFDLISPRCSARRTSSLAELCFSCRRSARSPMVASRSTGMPLMASSSWCCCGSRPASRAAPSLKCRKRRMRYRSSASARYSAGRRFVLVVMWLIS